MTSWTFRTAREALGLSQEALARALGKSLMTVQRWEGMVDPPILVKLAMLGLASMRAPERIKPVFADPWRRRLHHAGPDLAANEWQALPQGARLWVQRTGELYWHLVEKQDAGTYGYDWLSYWRDDDPRKPAVIRVQATD